ncbi:nucleotide sugar dehydrogenase [Candidatus Woesearchaeota archaeon]|nr:nucleotide sugar dehydrogenase [Candidatus Woesearchaeota archaeon]
MSSGFKVSVIGLGKAGLPLAAVIADAGIEVIGVDVDKQRAEDINSGKNPIPEENGLSELIKKNHGKNLKATSDPIAAAKESNAHIVIVPLFIDESTKKPDFSIIEKAMENVGKGLKKGDIVVLETTVPVKTTETLAKGILEKNSKLKAGTDFYLAHSPERIMTGYSISRFREFPKLVGGINSESTEKAFGLYKKFANPVKVSNAGTAELAKIAEGIYRDVNIALANELLKVSEKYGIDFWEMKEAARHQYCSILEPGNVGGHCIPVYPWFVLNEMEAPLIKEARKLNDGMAEYYVKKAINIAGKGKKIGIVGLSYREGVKEKAYSRAFAVIRLLRDKGYEVYGIDAMYNENEIKKEFGIEAIKDFNKMDSIILMNKNSEYIGKLKKMRNRVVDVKNTLK